MKNSYMIMRLMIPVMAATLGLLSVACNRDKDIRQGDYCYENRDLTRLENVNGILIKWADYVSPAQKEALVSIVSGMVRVEGGTFWMGAQKTNPAGVNFDSDAQGDESPVHQVTVSDFHIGKFELTQEQFYKLMGYELNWPARYGKGYWLPAYSISYETALQVVSTLNKLSNLQFRLPTEAEWEYAARGGANPDYTYFSGSNVLNDVAWTQQNAGAMVHDVGSKNPNGLGLYDMSGNVWEWCADNYATYTAGDVENPLHQSGNSYNYVLRGGSFNYVPERCRVSARDKYSMNLVSLSNGMRLVLYHTGF